MVFYYTIPLGTLLQRNTPHNCSSLYVPRANFQYILLLTSMSTIALFSIQQNYFVVMFATSDQIQLYCIATCQLCPELCCKTQGLLYLLLRIKVATYSLWLLWLHYILYHHSYSSRSKVMKSLPLFQYYMATLR